MAIGWKSLAAGIIIGIAIGIFIANTAPGVLHSIPLLVLPNGNLSTQNTIPISVLVSYVNVSGTINVSSVNLTSQGKLSGTLSYKATGKGFVAGLGNTQNYTVTIPNYSPFVMRVNTLSTQTQNFSTLTIRPNPPSTIGPNGSGNFTIRIKVPSRSYSGQLLIFFSANLTKG